MEQAEFIPLNTVNALHQGNPLQGLSRGGVVFIQWPAPDAESLWARFPLPARRSAREAGARIFYLDAARIAREESPRADLEVRMQGIALLGVFLRCSPFRERMALSDDALMEKAAAVIERVFGKTSPEVIAANVRCAQRGFREVKEVPPELIGASEGEIVRIYGAGRVGDVMHHGVITCGPEQPVEDVVKIMADQHISAIVVVNEAQRIEGIVSTTDVTRAAYHIASDSAEMVMLSRHLMTREVIVTWPEESLHKAVARMMEHHVHRLVVVKSEKDRQHPIGILSMTDLARAAGTPAPPQ
jgi:CBS domain-containing protein